MRFTLILGPIAEESRKPDNDLQETGHDMLNPATKEFGRTLPAGVLREIAPRYVQDPRDRWTGRAGLVAAPHNTEETAAIIRACAKAGVGVIPFGGGTGLVGGQVFTGDGPDPLLLTLERMNNVRGLYLEENVIAAEAGMTLQGVRDAAADADRMFPLSIGSQGTAQIGGILGTNAGGVNVIRWGNARALCLGIEAVLPDGSIMHGMTRLHKDNTGYDLRNLLIGSEGTLGVITAASLRLAPAPTGLGVAFLQVPSPAAALSLLSIAQSRMAGGVQAFELIHGMGLRFLAETAPQLRQPFATPPEWAVLIEVSLPMGMSSDTAIEGLVEAGIEAGLIEDGVLAQSGAQATDFWQLREHIPEANRKIGALASHDISLPLSEIAGFLQDCTGKIHDRTDMRVNSFGHLGDGNLHYNLFPAEGRAKADYDPNAIAVMTRFIHDEVMARGGSFSAEHGIGRFKAGELARRGDPARLVAMKAIKAALDPAGIMNPGAVLI